MFQIDQIILLAAVLLLLGIASSKASARLGLPVLVLFLLVGMLAGENGIGGIVFDDAVTAHALGSLALAFILYDGGLQSSTAAIKAVWKPAGILATLGVVVTAVITGIGASWILDLPLLEGILLGSIVGSTDAAAVFAQMRNAGLHIRERIKDLLEVESASNDPMAIFLTVGLLEVLVNDMSLGMGFLQLFFMQMGLGAFVGIGVGKAAVWLINRIHLNATGLYTVMVVAIGLLSFGIAANLGGSGFLAIYLTGIVVGNSRFVFQRGSFLFMDGLAWLSQITMFVVLGLLSNPEELIKVWKEGLAVAAVLILVARPVAVLPVLAPMGFSAREMSFVSWVGLRGSVPIMLAIFPLVFGLPGAALIFDVVFFVVLISAIVQGGTMAMVSRWLGLAEPVPVTPAATLEIISVAEIGVDIVKYSLCRSSRAIGRRIARMALPDGVVVAMIMRGNKVIPPRGSTWLQEGDQPFVVHSPEARDFVEYAFSCREESHETGTSGLELLASGGLLLKGDVLASDVLDSYDIDVGDGQSGTLEQILKQQLPEPAVGQQIERSAVVLRIQEMVGARILMVTVLPKGALPVTFRHP